MLNILIASLLWMAVGSGQLRAEALFLEGIDGVEEVGLQRLVMQKSLEATSGTSEFSEILSDFYQSLPYSSEESGSLWVSLWHLKSLAGPVWISERSSLGRRSQKATVSFLAEQILSAYEPCAAFSFNHSFLNEILRIAETRHLVKATEGYVRLLEALLPDQDISHQIVEVPVYTRVCDLWPNVNSSQQIAIIDRTPSSDPDSDAYLILVTRLQSE